MWLVYSQWPDTVAGQVTYRKLRRRTFIVEYLKEVKVVESLVEIYKVCFKACTVYTLHLCNL